LKKICSKKKIQETKTFDVDLQAANRTDHESWIDSAKDKIMISNWRK